MFIHNEKNLPQKRKAAQGKAQSAAILDAADMSTELAASLADSMEMLTSLVTEVTELSARVDALEAAKAAKK